MTSEQGFEKLIPEVVGPEPAMPLSSVTPRELAGMVVSEEEAFAEGYARIETESDRELITQTVAEFTRDLSGLEARVLRMRFGLSMGKPLSFRQIAKTTGIPKSTAFDAEKRAIVKLRNPHTRIA